MAFSVESRTPFLDYRVVEFAFQCPTAFHIRGGMRKALLRETIRSLVPEIIRTRKDKIGFATPEAQWKKECFAALSERAMNGLANGAGSLLPNGLHRHLTGTAEWRIIYTFLARQRFMGSVGT